MSRAAVLTHHYQSVRSVETKARPLRPLGAGCARPRRRRSAWGAPATHTTAPRVAQDTRCDKEQGARLRGEGSGHLADVTPAKSERSSWACSPWPFQADGAGVPSRDPEHPVSQGVLSCCWSSWHRSWVSLFLLQCCAGIRPAWKSLG